MKKNDRRYRPQLRFTEEQYEELIKLAITKGYIGAGDIGDRIKVKAKIERMILKELGIKTRKVKEQENDTEHTG